MKLLDRIRYCSEQYARDANPAEPHATKMASLLHQTVEWMTLAEGLLARAREYTSCDIHSTEYWGAEAKALYDELCLFGADQLDRDPAWSRGVQDAIKAVNDEMQHYTRLHPPVGAAVVGLTAFEAAKSCLQSLLARGSYEKERSPDDNTVLPRLSG